MKIHVPHPLVAVPMSALCGMLFHDDVVGSVFAFVGAWLISIGIWTIVRNRKVSDDR